VPPVDDKGPSPHGPLGEIVDYYTYAGEESRLSAGSSQLEFERTKELLARFLPASPAQIADVGGAAGAYAFWLAGQGYRVHLVDATPRLVEAAERHDATCSQRLASIAVGDARRLSFADCSVDAVLLLGPLYHLIERAERIMALREARRILRPHGVVAAAGISRYAGTLDGLVLNSTLAPHVIRMRHRALADGRYRNDTDNRRYFVTAYFHRPEDLAGELIEVGFQNVRVFGVEGPGWLVSDFDARWRDADLREGLLEVARLLEQEASIIGASPHILAVGGAG